MRKVKSSKEKAIEIFRKQKGVLRTSEAMKHGVHSVVLYQLRDEGQIQSLSRGVYRLVGSGQLSAPDLAIVAKRIHEGIICLTSVLAFHNITTEIPHEVHVALGRTKRYPKLEYPPVRIFRYSGTNANEGIEHHLIDGIDVKMYSIPRTIVDCFKFRNKVGLSIAIEALKESIRERKTTRKEILRYAELLRMKRVIMPYLEALS